MQAQFEAIEGTMLEAARTSGGSSFLQASLRDKDPVRYNNVYAELSPHFSQLLLDSHGCYVMRTLMEMMPPEHLEEVVQLVASDSQLTFSLCTHSLHTRRVLQFFLEAMEPERYSFIVDMMIDRCAEVAKTQQGCIAIQRVMDNVRDDTKTKLRAAIFKHLVEFSVDPFANYVVQYILNEEGDREVLAQQILEQFRGHVYTLACNKFASNVVEKVLHCVGIDIQHRLVEELYSVDESKLETLLQDSFGNYIVQSTIAVCTIKDVLFIQQSLQSILHSTPYGYKIAGRLERRLKGKALGGNVTAKAHHHQQPEHHTPKVAVGGH